jgi:hypothetical protein
LSQEPSVPEKPFEGQGPTATEQNARWALKNIEEALTGLHYGVVTIQVQDGVIVQVERTERRRYQRP